MRNLGKRLFEIITIVLVCSTVLSADGRICRAAGENPVADGSSTISELPTVDENPTVGEVYSTALEAAYGDTFRSVYENRLAGSPLEADPADGVDPATGHLILTRTDLSLDGTGGMDFELARYYDSNEANLGHATVEQVSELRRDTVWVGYTAQDGTKRELIVSTALLKNHKDALKNLTGTSYRVIKKQHDDVIRPEGGTQRTKTVSNEGHSV